MSSMQTDNDTFATACEFTAPSQEEVKDLSQALLTPVNEQDQNDEEENDDEEKEENDDEEHPDHQSADRDEGTGVLDDDNDDNDDDKSVQEKKDPIHTLCKATHAELTNLGKALTCPICQSTYQNAVILPCVHAYCRNCIVQALRVKQECPTCKHAPCSKRSLVECPLLNEMAVAYKRITRAVGWSPSVYSQSVTMTQLPVGDGETTHLVDCHEQLQAAKTWQRAMDSSEENPILRDERAKVVQVNQTAIVQAAVKKRRSSSRGKSLESQKSVSFQAADSSSSIAQEDDETEEHKQQDAVEISEPTETEDTPKDRGDIDDDDDETVGPDPPTVNENKSQDKQSQDDQHRPDNVSTATVPMEIGDDDKEGGTQQEGEEAAIEEPQEDIPIANDDDDDDTVGPQQEEEESADVEQQPQDNTPMANDDDDDDDTVGPQEEEEKAAVEQHPQDNAPMENDDDDDTVGPQKDGEKAAVEQQPQDNDPMANDDDDDDDDNVGPQEEEKAAVEQQPQDNAPMANGDDDDDDTVKLQEKEASASVEQQQEEEDFVIANNDDDEDVDNEQPPAEARRDDGMTTTTGISVGAIVRVQSRTWPGINKPGGVARVAKVHPDSHSYDVAYVLGGTEKSVGAAHIVVVNDESSQSPQQRRRGNTGNELPVSVLQALARDGFDTARTKRKPAVASQKENKKKQGKTTPKSATTTIKKKATKRKEHTQDVIPTKKKSRKAPVEIVLPELDNEDKCKLANERYQKLIEAAMKDGIVHVVVSSLPEDVQAKLDVLVRDTKNQDVKIKVHEAFNPKTTTLAIMPAESKEDQGLARVRTLKAMRASLAGVPVVTIEWIKLCCAKEKIVVPDASMFIHSLPTKTKDLPDSLYGTALMAARLHQVETGAISKDAVVLPLKNVVVHLCGAFSRPPKSHVQHLLRESGATIQPSMAATIKLLQSGSFEPGGKKVVFLCDDASDNNLCGINGAQAGEIESAIDSFPERVMAVSAHWVFDVITCGRKVPANHFEPKSQRCKQLWSASCE